MPLLINGFKEYYYLTLNSDMYWLISIEALMPYRAKDQQRRTGKKYKNESEMKPSQENF